MTASHFYPEMDQAAPASAIIIGRVAARKSGYYVKWTAANHREVVALSSIHGVIIKNVEEFVTVKGEIKWSGHMTPKAFDKLRAAGVAAVECLLD